jgi:hypothetical protein
METRSSAATGISNALLSRRNSSEKARSCSTKANQGNAVKHPAHGAGYSAGGFHKKRREPPMPSCLLLESIIEDPVY